MIKPEDTPRPGTLPEPARDGFADCFAGDDWKRLLQALEGDGPARSALLADAEEYGRRRGTSYAAYFANYLFCGDGLRHFGMKSPAEVINALAEGDCELADSLPAYGDGDTWAASALPLALTWCLSQRFDRARAALVEMGHGGAFRDLSEDCDTSAREAFEQALNCELVEIATRKASQEGGRHA